MVLSGPENSATPDVPPDRLTPVGSYPPYLSRATKTGPPRKKQTLKVWVDTTQIKQIFEKN